MTAMIRRWRDHDNERSFDPPDPVVRLIPGDTVQARKPTNLPEPELSDSILHDHETLDIGRWGPLAAYRLAASVMGDASFAASWSSFVKEQARWHRTLEALRWQYEHGGHG